MVTRLFLFSLQVVQTCKILNDYAWKTHLGDKKKTRKKIKCAKMALIT